jgi:protein-tyrosine kinase
VKVLAEIPPRSSPDLRTGTLRRSDLEAFGGLLEELHGAGVVLITGEGAGRQEASVGLAAAAAATGTRTALVECDLAEPRLADALGLAQAPGLREYLRGTAESDSILKPVVLAGPGSAEATEPRVCVVAGRPAGDAAALLASDGLRPAIEGLRSAYELVVIDGPSLRDEHGLAAVSAFADSTLACLGPSDPRNLSTPVSGVVIQH